MLRHLLPAGSPEAPAAEEANGGNIVKSPIVGTYYRSPSPDKPPFVKVGDKVKKGDVIMIIESMKLMNEVQSEFDGVVERILVTDGQAVEYDQPIMIIKMKPSELKYITQEIIDKGGINVSSPEMLEEARRYNMDAVKNAALRHRLNTIVGIVIILQIPVLLASVCLKLTR